MTDWSKLFDLHGAKSVSYNDKKKSAYVPSQEQKDALNKAGLEPADGGPGPPMRIRVLGDSARAHVTASYYRAKGHPQRERRMGRQIISDWLEVGDEVLIGVRHGQIFLAKVTDPSTHLAIVDELLQATTENHPQDDCQDLEPVEIDTLAGPMDLHALDQLTAKYQDVSPAVRHIISKHIERGAVGRYVKRAAGYRCQICASLGRESLGFPTPSGVPYVEAHHVMPVALMETGCLGPRNVIAICPNHHRQLHYGRVSVSVQEHEFIFTIDGVIARVNRNAA